MPDDPRKDPPDLSLAETRALALFRETRENVSEKIDEVTAKCEYFCWSVDHLHPSPLNGAKQ